MLISFAAPAGDLGKGQVENVEVMRIAMTHSTFKDVVGLFSYTLGELGLSEQVPPPALAPANEPVQHSEHVVRSTPEKHAPASAMSKRGHS